MKQTRAAIRYAKALIQLSIEKVFKRNISGHVACGHRV